jgi:hypothetical protein
VLERVVIAESCVSEPGYELVRVSREMVKQLLDDESEPVVVMRMERHEDGTCELWLRKVVHPNRRVPPDPA